LSGALRDVLPGTEGNDLYARHVALTQKLKLKVNEAKSVVALPRSESFSGSALRAVGHQAQDRAEISGTAQAAESDEQVEQNRASSLLIHHDELARQAEPIPPVLSPVKLAGLLNASLRSSTHSPFQPPRARLEEPAVRRSRHLSITR
jgi:hypothetical protein